MSKYRHILLVDDDEGDRELFLEALREIDPSVSCETAKDGAAALQSLLSSTTPPELIFLDINMPRVTGIDFLKLVKNDQQYAAFKHIPVSMLTTSSHEEENCLSLGAQLYLVKPIDYHVFRKMISTVLDTADIAHAAAVIKTIHPGSR